MKNVEFPKVTIPQSRFLAVCILLLVVCSIAIAKPTDKGQCQKAAHGWLQRHQNPMERPISNTLADIQTVTVDRQPLYHIVQLAPAGFLIVSADTEIEPVIAFSATGHFQADPDSPLTTLLEKDMKGRLENIQNPSKKRTKAGNKARKWQSLLEPEITLYGDEPFAAASEASVSDVWVDPFVLSEWNQGDVGGTPCYNYYTPNNYVSGCVATAMAQVMRYHTWPTSNIGVHAFTIEVNYTTQTAYTKGVTYNWSQMPLDPASGVTTTQRQAIGTLCYDAGVVAEMSYTATGSGASLYDADQGMTSIFQFSNSIYTQNFLSSGDDRLWNILNANLDAQLPVILGISRVGGGHAVVADGYGYTGETLYHHINMGWGGYDNAWYQLPTIDASSQTYTVIDDCVYNLYTTGSGEIISGRVTNMAGSPISGVTVSAYQGASLIRQATTNNHGVYALNNLPSNTQFTISAAKSGENFLSQTVTTGQSTDWSIPGNRSGILFVSATTGPPTAYDMQIDVDATDSALIELQGLDDGLPDPNLFRCIITSLPAHGLLNEPNVGPIEMVPYELTSSIYDVNYLPCPYFGGQDAFTYKANDGGTYPTGGDSNIATVTINVNQEQTTDYHSESNSYINGVLLDTTSRGVRSQMIYLPSEMGAGTPKRITDLAIRVKTVPGRTLSNFTIRMKHTTLGTYTSLYQIYNDSTIVYQADETLTTGWNWFHFDNPFDYNGTSNLMIDVSYWNSGTATAGSYYLYDTGQARNYMMYDDNGDAGSPLNWDYYSNWDSYWQSDYLPVMQFISVAPVDPVVGDFDASCDVKMPDVAIFSQAWMATLGQTDYNAECDLTAVKGAVDMQDLLILMGQWLEKYPY